MLKQILEIYTEYSFFKMDGFDDAVIGFDEETYRLVYSVKLIIENLSKEMSYEEAIEYFEFNIQQGCFENKPILCFDNF